MPQGLHRPHDVEFLECAAGILAAPDGRDCLAQVSYQHDIGRLIACSEALVGMNSVPLFML